MVGIDVSKNSLAVCLWDSTKGIACWSQEFTNSEAGIRGLIERTSPEEPWALEPTGRYSELVVRLGLAHGRKVLLAPPRGAKQFLASISPRAKTDRKDAQGLAIYACSVALKPFVLKTRMMEKLSQLLTARKSLAKSLTSFRLQEQALPDAAGILRVAADSLAAQLKELDKDILRLSREEPAIEKLQKIPGVGPVSSAALVVRLKSTDFSSYDKFVAYVGLDVRVRQSGIRRGNAGLSKQGDAELRRLLYCCAQASLRTKDSPFAKQYERERAKGLSSTQALCAVARKLAKVAWALVRSGQDYDPKRVYSQNSLDK